MLEVAGGGEANPSRYAQALAGKTLFMYFEKPSLRTRVTFEAGMTQLGGRTRHLLHGGGRQDRLLRE
jgi:ornithine carbamoyltransferase